MTQAISQQYAVVLTRAAKTVKRDRFATQALSAMTESAGSELGLPTAGEEALGALWRLGMVGAINGRLESGEARFYGHSEHDGPMLPEAERFALHASMIDYLGPHNIRAVGDPVYPEPGFLAALGVADPQA
jgi:hypothetical protein